MTHEEGQSDRRYWDLLEAAPDGILEVAADGAIVLSNAMAAKMFGHDREELVGKVVEYLVPSQYRPGGLLRRTMYLLTLVSPISMLSLSSSP
jgi:PAS domain S-box-containing protein